MHAMKCDRCGKFYDFYQGSDRSTGIKANYVRLYDSEFDSARGRAVRGVLDLCEDCMTELETFLYGGAENV